MKNLKELGRVLTKLEQSTINGGAIPKCGRRCTVEEVYYNKECCKSCDKWYFCSIMPTNGFNDDVPTIV